jgi:hypothetical protein
MTTAWLNRLGDRNPQLLRELRGRWQGRGIATTLALVVLIQLLIVLFFVQKLPTVDRWSEYCVNLGPSPQSTEMPRLLSDCLIDWRGWWRDLFKFLLYAVPYIFYIPGLYVLLTDIGQETQRGTLNFLRLSPRSGQTLLLGKLLGVPILGYFSLLLLLPLHILATLRGEVPLGFLVSFYGSLLAWGGVLFVGAMLIGVKAPRSGNANLQGLGIVVVAAIGLIPGILTWNNATIWQSFDLWGTSVRRIDWFLIPINQGVLVPHLFLGLNLAIWGYFLWQVLQRAFQHPNATMLSKRQGYFVMGYGALFVFGLTLQSQFPLTEFARAGILSQFGLWLSLGLIAVLSTPRQMILDWLSYRQAAAATGQTGPWRPAALRDWVWGEKSPGITAIGINLLLLASFTLPPLLFLALPVFRDWQVILAVLLSLVLVMNYALLAQLMLLLKTPKRNAWAVGMLALAIFLPPLLALILSIDGGSSSFYGRFSLLLSPWLWQALDLPRASVTADSSGLLAALALEMAGFVGLSWLLRLKLRQLQR